MDESKRPIDIHERIVEFIDSSRSFALALILKAEGSTPRKAGVKAIIDESGKIWGTLGGGVVEAEAQRHAIDACQSKQPVVFDLELQGIDSADDVPICGGQMRILIDPNVAKNEACFARVAQAIRNRQRSVLLTTAHGTTDMEVTYQWFPEEEIPSDAIFPGSENIRSCLAREAVKLFTKSSREPNVFIEALVEPIIPKPALLIAGGGHIGQALSLQASLVGFDVTVVDERAEFTDPTLFPNETKTICGDIAQKISSLVLADTYVVIVTRGHKLDAEVLEACIHSQAMYIGMIGSKRKVALMRRHFIETNLATGDEFDRIFTPIGLEIGAVTVPEIASSITAELIAVRRKSITHKVPHKEKFS